LKLKDYDLNLRTGAMVVQECIGKHVSFNRYVKNILTEMRDKYSDPKSALMQIADIKGFDRTFEKFRE